MKLWHVLLICVPLIMGIVLPGTNSEEIKELVNGFYCEHLGHCTLQTLNITNTSTGSSNLIYNNGTHLIITGNGCFGAGC